MTLERTPATLGARYDWIDYARIAAALSVMVYHYYTYAPAKGFFGQGAFGAAISPVTAYGLHGVELFFMISGFVIMLSVADRSAADFAAARIRRLYPGFLFCMSVTAIALLVSPMPQFPVTLGKYLANATMLAGAFGAKNMDPVYWTLTKELVFYGAVCLMLLAGQRARLEGIAQVWLVLRAGASVLGIEAPLLGETYELFIAGCLLFFGTTRGWTWRRAIAVGVAAVLVVDGMIRRGKINDAALGISLDPVVLTLMGLGFFALFLLMARLNPRLPAGPAIGAPTYPLYLLHDILGAVLIGHLATFIGIEGAILLVAAAMIAFAAAVAHFVERRPRALWTRLARWVTRPLAAFESWLSRLQTRPSSPLKGP